MSMTSAVRQPLWRGTQAVAGLWLPSSLHSRQVRSQRLLLAWRTGSVACRFEQGDLLRYAEPVVLACEGQPALPLCKLSDGRLASAPLTDTELAEHRAGDLLIVEGGDVVALVIDQAKALDLSALVDIGDYALHDTFDCSHSVETPAVERLAGKDLRRLLGDAIPAPSAERAAFMETLAGGGKAGRGGLASGSTRKRLAIARDHLFSRVAGMLLGVLPAGDAGSAGVARRDGRGGAAGNALRARNSPLLPQAWRERLAKLAMLSRMSKLIGWHQGAYLRKMMDMFDDGDLQEALRHALPIDSQGGSLGQAFGAPGRRGDLSLSGSLGASADIGLPDELREHLRRLYRQSFERLDSANRIDEAVFVLAELLNARQEALDYLERHQRVEQAAELALRWDMPAATIVRLLLLAGDWQRAVQVARRDNEFAAVVAALASTHPDLVLRLRLAWGESLADRGDWLAAVEAVWPVPQARHIAAHWLLLAERAGGTLSARALVQRAELLPDTIDSYKERILNLGRDAEAAAARAALAEAILQSKGRNEAMRVMATSALPALAADRAAGRNELSKNQLNRLATFANDPFLRADLPGWSLPAIANKANFWNRSGTLALEPPAAGLQPICDAVALPDDRYLLALGESGAVVVDRQGRPKQRYAVPAYRLVIAKGQHAALAVAPRETFSRVTRLDLVNHTIVDLGAIRLQSAAGAFDGVGWSLVSDGRILVVDTGKSLRDVLWHVGDLPGAIIASRYMESSELHLIDTHRGFELWHYAVEGRRLVARNEVRYDRGKPVLLLPSGPLQPRAERTDAGLRISYDWYSLSKVIDIPLNKGLDPAGVSWQGLDYGILIGLGFADHTRYCLHRGGDGHPLLRFDWPAGALLQSREQNGRLLFFDDQGRFIELLLATELQRRISMV